MKIASGTKVTLCMAACMMFGLGLTGCGTTTVVTDTSSTNSSLKAGAGSAEIQFPSALFATPSVIEGFDGTIHDTPHARVMVLETNSKVAIVSLELVRTDADVVSDIKGIVSDATGVPQTNVYVHSNHTITTPHEPSDATLFGYWKTAVEDAVTTATAQAVSSFQPAVAGVATGTSNVNVNRNVQMSDGKFHIGLTDTTHASNKTMTIVGLKSMSGTPIGFLMSYGVKPTCVDNAGQAANQRQISTDVPGMAANMMETAFSAPTLYLMGATGDQVPKCDFLRAYDYGNGTVTDNYDYSSTNPSPISGAPSYSMDQIFATMATYGTQMGNDAIAIAKTISYTQAHPAITFANTTFSWPASSYSPGGNDPTFTAGQLNVVPVFAIRFGDIAFIGTKPEIDAATEQQLIAVGSQLGYSHVMLDSFVDGDSKYMPHAEAYGTTSGSTLYPVKSVEAGKTGFVKGAAEEFVTTANVLLNGFLGQNLADTTPPSAIYTLTAPSGGSVTITLIAYDDISGVNSITTPDGKINQTSTVTYKVTADATYNFILMDNAGNQVTFPVVVSTI